MIHELKEYFPKEGRFDALAERFRLHTLRIFKRLGIVCTGAWISGEGDERSLVYIVRFRDKDEQAQQWRAFAEDEEWLSIKQESERPSGPLMERQTSQILVDLQTDDV